MAYRMKPRIGDEAVMVAVRLTPEQFREINRCAQLGPIDNKARSEYIAGCLFGESRDGLLKRVREIRDVERRNFRAELESDRARRARTAQDPVGAEALTRAHPDGSMPRPPPPDEDGWPLHGSIEQPA
jgi:hypothetical protein